MSHNPDVKAVINADDSTQPGIPSIHDLATTFAETQKGRKELGARVSKLIDAYEKAIAGVYKEEGWFLKCQKAIVAGNVAFRSIYDTVWTQTIVTGEVEGIKSRFRPGGQRVRVRL